MDEATTQPRSSYSEAIRKLLFTLQMIVGRGKKLGVVLVTSTETKEGKSTLALSLARSAALAGARVVVVDANLRHPGIHHALNLPNETGLANLLAATASEHQVVQCDPKSQCRVITSGQVGNVPPEYLLGTEQIRDTIQKLEAEYDVVILDASPVGLYADTLLFADIADVILFAVRAGAAKPNEIKAALAQLRRYNDVDTFAVMTFRPPQREDTDVLS